MQSDNHRPDPAAAEHASGYNPNTRGVLGFDQPLNGLAQMAFVVPDVRAAALQWTASCNAGPWFVIDALAAPDGIY